MRVIRYFKIIKISFLLIFRQAVGIIYIYVFPLNTKLLSLRWITVFSWSWCERFLKPVQQRVKPAFQAENCCLDIQIHVHFHKQTFLPSVGFESPGKSFQLSPVFCLFRLCFNFLVLHHVFSNLFSEVWPMFSLCTEEWPFNYSLST